MTAFLDGFTASYPKMADQSGFSGVRVVSYAKLTPAAFISFVAASNDPPKSIALHRSILTVTINPSFAASTAEKLTQKSVANPTSVSVSIPRARRYPSSPVGVVLSFSKKAK